jgi:ethanolamine utilization cobalamin adenosyltransferase
MKKTSRETCLYPAGKDAPEAVVGKDHPEIEFRGRMDTLDAVIILAAAVARKEGARALAKDLIELQRFARGVTSAHASGRSLEPEALLGRSYGEIHRLSHRPPGGHPDLGEGTSELLAYVNLVRTQVRSAERAAVRALADRDDIVDALNVLSSAVHVLLCSLHAREKGARA